MIKSHNNHALIIGILSYTHTYTNKNTMKQEMQELRKYIFYSAEIWSLHKM